LQCTRYCTADIGGDYTWFTGTSAATPFVADVAALLKSRSPGLSAAIIKNYIANSVTKIPALVNNCSTDGLLNAYGALSGGYSTVKLRSIQSVVVPTLGETPVKEIVSTGSPPQYTGTLTWLPNHSTFQSGVRYTATIILNAGNGYTFYGIGENFFNVQGASITNLSDTGIVTAVFPVVGTFGGGNGTWSTPYLVKNVDQLKNVKLFPDSFFELANDIIFECYPDNWTSIPEFWGTLDGKNYKISNIKILATEYGDHGLFGINYGDIKNLTIEGSMDIQVDGYVGMFAGKN